MFRKMLITGATAASLLVSGCAGNDSGDMAGALLIGAAVVGLGVLAATSSDDDEDDDYERDSHRQRSSRYNHQDERRRHRNDNDYGNEYRYAGNGRCDDPSYRTSNGGHAASGTDERDCRRYGDGRR